MLKRITQPDTEYHSFCFGSAIPKWVGGWLNTVNVKGLREKSVNTDNYNQAVARMGPDNLASAEFF
jgi:hypothetical protein